MWLSVKFQIIHLLNGLDEKLDLKHLYIFICSGSA